MNKPSTTNKSKKKKLLAAVLEYFLQHNDFPEKKKFRITLGKVECDLLDEMVNQQYFSKSSEDYDKYVLSLVGLISIDNKESQHILKVGNQLLPIFKEFYERDQSFNSYWTVEQLSDVSKLSKEDIEKALFFLKDMYLYFNGRQYKDSNNKYIFKSIGLDERIRWFIDIKKFAKKHLIEKKKIPPSLLLKKVENIVTAEYGADRLVAFLDVLGFKEIIKKKVNAERYFNSITTILKNIKNTESKSQIQYALISDSVVLSYPFDGDINNINEFFIALGRIQAELCLGDTWLRGAVTIGGIKMQEVGDNQVVFGPALSDAYMLESDHAKFPRILLDPRIFQKLKTTRKGLISELEQLNTDSDFFKSILFDPSVRDFFSDGRETPGTNIMNDGVWINFFEFIRKDKILLREFSTHLKTHLYEGQEHFEKYKWVHNYALLEYNSKVHPLTFDHDLNDLASF